MHAAAASRAGRAVVEHLLAQFLVLDRLDVVHVAKADVSLEVLGDHPQ